MGKGYVRFRKLDDLALDVIGRSMRATLRRNFIGKRHAKITQRNAPAPTIERCSAVGQCWCALPM
jgi:hypothetical protein